jgi:hypothetical protein
MSYCTAHAITTTTTTTTTTIIIIAIINKDSVCSLIDVALPSDRNVIQKEAEDN